MSSKVRDFRQRETKKDAPIYSILSILNPQSLILNLQSSSSIIILNPHPHPQFSSSSSILNPQSSSLIIILNHHP